MDLHIRVDGSGPDRTIFLEGACDLATAPELRQTLLELAPPEVINLVIDVSELEFCDSTGLGTMLGALRRMREGGGELVISGSHGIFQRLLEVTGIDKIVPLR